MNKTIILSSIVLSVAFVAGTAHMSTVKASDAPQNFCVTMPAGTTRTTEFESSLNKTTHVATVKNISKVGCTYAVGYASYKIYDPKTSSEVVTSQTLFDSRSAVLRPGESVTFTDLKIPACAYQLDLFQGELLKEFKPGEQYYAGTGRLLKTTKNFNDLCPKVTPTPTPTATPTPTTTSTPEPTATPTPEELPSTGPGAAVAIAMSGIILALVGKKFIA